MLVLLLYKTQTTWPGLVIVLTGIPVYFVWKSVAKKAGLRVGAAANAEESRT